MKAADKNLFDFWLGRPILVRVPQPGRQWDAPTEIMQWQSWIIQNSKNKIEEEDSREHRHTPFQSYFWAEERNPHNACGQKESRPLSSLECERCWMPITENNSLTIFSLFFALFFFYRSLLRLRSDLWNRFMLLEKVNFALRATGRGREEEIAHSANRRRRNPCVHSSAARQPHSLFHRSASIMNRKIISPTAPVEIVINWLILLFSSCLALAMFS